MNATETLASYLADQALHGAVDYMTRRGITRPDDAQAARICDAIRDVLRERLDAILADAKRALDPFGLGLTRNSPTAGWASFSVQADALLAGVDAVRRVYQITDDDR
jgi:hypothetical protein